MDNNINNSDNKFYYSPVPSALPSIENEKKILFDFTKRDLIFSILFAVLSFIIVDFIALHGLNLGFTIAFILLFALSSAYLYKPSIKASAFSYLCGVLSIAASLTFTLTHDYMMNVFMLVLTLGLFTIYTCGISGVFTRNEGSCKLVFDLVSGIFAKPLNCLPSISRSFSKSFNKQSGLKYVIVGIVIALPVMIVIVPLLSSSDEAFSGLVSMMLKNVGVYIGELVAAAVIAPFLVSYFVSKNKKFGIESNIKNSFGGKVPSAVAVSFLSVISVTYVVYLFSQLAYFFSAFSGILPDGYTFSASEYARRGFFEMFAICVINFIIISLASVLTKRDSKCRVPLAVKILSAFIVSFSMLLLITAMEKMKLNIEYFGMSKNRVLVSVFMLMMLVAIVFYFIHIFKPRFSYFQALVLVCSIMLCVLSYSNLDARIAQYNVEKYLNGELDSIDVEYLSSLSDSAFEYITQLADAEDHLVAKEAKSAICSLKNDNMRYMRAKARTDSECFDIEYLGTDDFREFNLSKQKSLKAIEKYYNSLTDAQKTALERQWELDNSGKYIYVRADDAYYKDEYEHYGKYGYNAKSGRYEYMGVSDYEYGTLCDDYYEE